MVTEVDREGESDVTRWRKERYYFSNYGTVTVYGSYVNERVARRKKKLFVARV
jgi:hypothetical protein